MLTALILTPLAGALLLTTMREDSTQAVSRVKQTALLASVVAFAVAMLLWLQFDSASSELQFTVKYAAFPHDSFNVDTGVGSVNVSNNTSYFNMHLGLDGLSLYFVLLTAFTMPICVLASWSNVQHSVKSYMIALLVLQSLLTTAFVVQDLLLFYVFFEAVLVPLFVLVGVWGASADRVRAAFLLFLYTLLGSLFMLLAFIVIASATGTTDLQVLSLAGVNFAKQQWLWIAIFASLAVKTPLLPVHIWLSRAHVQASVAVSMILAGLVLKLATYAYVRILLPMLPEASSYYAPLVQTVCVVTLIYSSLTTLRQTDFKVLVAYSSVAHMSVVVIGLFSNSLQGIEGALLLSIAHGVVSPALFYCLGGVLYDRYHTRQLRYYRGLLQYMPVFAMLLFMFVLGNMSTPLTLNWIGELLALLGAMQRSAVVGAAMSTGIVLSACYSIWLYARMTGGTWSPYLGYAVDVTRREVMVLLPLLATMLVFGVCPNIILTDLHYSVTALLNS